MRISMPRGDIRIISFGITQFDPAIGENVPCEIEFTEIYFTVKRNYMDSEYFFQKKLSAGGITMLEPGVYQVKIEPQDTTNMPFNRPGESYDFDIQIEYNDEVKQTTTGEFVITKEVTWARNESE